MDVGLVVKAFQTIVRDRNPQKEMTVDDINNYLRFAFEDFYNEFLDKFEEGLDVSNGAWIETITNASVNATTGELVVTSSVSNCKDVIKFYYGDIEVDVLTIEEWSDVLTSSIIAPTLTNPVCIKKGINTWEFRPKNIGNVSFKYFPYLPTSVVNGDLPLYKEKVENGIPVYDAANSFAISLSDKYFTELVKRMLEYAGISISAIELTEYSNKTKNI